MLISSFLFIRKTLIVLLSFKLIFFLLIYIFYTSFLMIKFILFLIIRFTDNVSKYLFSEVDQSTHSNSYLKALTLIFKERGKRGCTAILIKIKLIF